MNAIELRHKTIENIIKGVDEMLMYCAVKKHLTQWTYECDGGYAEALAEHYQNKGYGVRVDRVGWGCGNRNNRYVTIAW